MKKDMPLEGLRWSRDSGSALYDTPPNGRSRTGWGEERDEYGNLYVEMNVGKPLLDIETWTLLVDAREISMT